MSVRTMPPGTASPAHPEERLRVLIVDPDPPARRSVRSALQDAGIAVIADVGDGRQAGELARHYRPDVVVTEAHLPDGCALELARGLTRDVPQTRVVLLSAREDEDLQLRALRAGAVGTLRKDGDPAVLPHVLRRVASGEAAIPRRLVMRLVESLREVPEAGWRPVRSRLTSREWEIVDLLSDGASTDAMAERLVLSPATVYSHVKSLLRKLGVHSRGEAVAAAQRLRREEMPLPV